MRFYAHLHGMRARKWYRDERLHKYMNSCNVEYQISSTDFPVRNMHCACVGIPASASWTRLSGSWTLELLALAISFQFQKGDC